MRGKHANKRKKQETADPSISQIVVESTSQEQRDDKKEDHMAAKGDDTRGLLRNKVFDPALLISAVALLISALALFASFWQAWLTRETLRIDQRAWVGFGTMLPVTLLQAGQYQAGQPFVVTVPLQNTGKTPALGISAGLTMAIAHYDEPPDFDKLLEPYIHPPIAIQLPGQVDELHAANQHSGGELTPSDLKMLTDPKNTIFVFGKVTYVDIFGIMHWTRYCQEMMPDVPPSKVKFRNCNLYTGTDQK